MHTSVGRLSLQVETLLAALVVLAHPHVEEQGVEERHTVSSRTGAPPRVQLQSFPLGQPALVLDGLQQPLLARAHVVVPVGLQ
eukprot:3985729-Lingulodinium_polyedra.AAC.1